MTPVNDHERAEKRLLQIHSLRGPIFGHPAPRGRPLLTASRPSEGPLDLCEPDLRFVDAVQAAFRLIRFEVTNPHNPHRAFPSVRGLGLVEALVVFERAVFLYDEMSDDLRVVEGNPGRCGELVGALLVVDPDALPVEYADIAFALGCLELGHATRNLVHQLLAEGVSSPMTRIDGVVAAACPRGIIAGPLLRARPERAMDVPPRGVIVWPDLALESDTVATELEDEARTESQRPWSRDCGSWLLPAELGELQETRSAGRAYKRLVGRRVALAPDAIAELTAIARRNGPRGRMWILENTGENWMLHGGSPFHIGHDAVSQLMRRALAFETRDLCALILFTISVTGELTAGHVKNALLDIGWTAQDVCLLAARHGLYCRPLKAIDPTPIESHLQMMSDSAHLLAYCLVLGQHEFTDMHYAMAGRRTVA